MAKEAFNVISSFLLLLKHKLDKLATEKGQIMATEVLNINPYYATEAYYLLCMTPGQHDEVWFCW